MEIYLKKASSTSVLTQIWLVSLSFTFTFGGGVILNHPDDEKGGNLFDWILYIDMTAKQACGRSVHDS
jgi:hypothetical protein